ncbi:MAG TPA: globin domain-containing protein [Polyangiaceae bacterium]|nr:globin domain-containing protein [Polyangiaceae bacterium]
MNDKQLIEDNLAVITERAPDVVGRFYAKLFERNPALKGLFGRRSQAAQEKMVLDAIVAVVDHMEDVAWLRSVLLPLGAKHVSYGVTEGMYPLVADALVATLAESSGDRWNDATSAAWGRALGAVAGLMIEGARGAADAEAVPTARVANG